jgi:hypothetical protein
VVFIALLNLSIFYTNLRWLLSSAESVRMPAGLPVDLRPRGYGRGVAKFVGKLFISRDVESRKFNIDAVTGEFVPVKEIRPKPNKYFVSHPVVISGVTSTSMTAMRQLVGSIHFWHPELTVWLYEIGTLTDRHRSEITLWEDTKLLDGVGVLRMVLLDSNLILERGPLSELQRELREQRREDGAFGEGELPPATEVNLRKLLLGGRLALAPALMWHALQHNAVVMYLDHTAHTRGWIDNVLKALVRDGFFFVQEETTRGGCNPVLQGYRARTNLTEVLLRRHLICALGGRCPSEDSGTLRPDERPDLHNWWGLRPDSVDGDVCHDARMSKISTEESLRQLAEDGDLVAKASVGEQYHCRLRRIPVPPELVYQSDQKTVGLGHSHGPGSIEEQIMHIAIGVPTSTAGTQLTQPDLLPILNVLLPSMLGTIDKSTHTFKYTLYVGFDLGDSMYDTDQKQRRLQKRMTTMVGEYPVMVKLVRFNVSLSTTYIWNGLFRSAMADGADYFMNVHDDTEFYPSQGGYWSDIVVQSLQQNILAQNFGVASPLDMRDPKVVTHAFVHRTHYEVFGEMFPRQLSNLEHDDWMSRVYGYKNTFFHSDIQVYNTHRFTGRAMPCKLRGDIVDHEVYMGAEKIKRWAVSNLGSFTSALHSDTTGIKSR